MAAEPTVVCPKCRAEIKLTEAMAGPLVANARAEFERQLGTERTRIRAEETQAVATEANAAIQRAQAAAAAAERALQKNEAKLAEAQAAQAEALRTQRLLDEERRELALNVERQVATGVAEARATARQEAEASVGLRVAERDEQIASMGRVIEELKRKAEQGSQQMQGEAQELQLEAALRHRFPLDAIEPVAKGQSGGDVVHHVTGGAGAILYEFKRTKNWSDGWLPKLRADGRAAKADVLVLVTQVLPPGWAGTGFDCVDGVWVCHPTVAMPVASALREGLLRVRAARRAADGAETKAVAVYGNLTGPRFRARVEAIVEAFATMRRDLDAERTAMTRIWAKREAQLGRAVDATAGMYGDLQGIAGADAGELEGLSLPALEGP